MRMDYRDAIKYLNEHDITRPGEDGVDGPHVVGDDIAEAAERKMTDQIGKPIFLMKFPMEIVRSFVPQRRELNLTRLARQKSFYMQRCEGDRAFTESCDLLMPNVGEIVGSSLCHPDCSRRERAHPSRRRWLDAYLRPPRAHGRVQAGRNRLNPLVRHFPRCDSPGLRSDPPVLSYWYSDQRKYGTSPHGGYGLGVEVSISIVLSYALR